MNGLVQALVGVVVGSVLATCGILLTAYVAAVLERRRRARNAALLCGEILAAIEALILRAGGSSTAGDFANPLTPLYLRAVGREVEVYVRNREMLFNITDGALRAQVHSFMLRISISVNRLFDAHSRLASSGHAPGEADLLRSAIDQSSKYLIDSGRHIPKLLARLQPLAGERLDIYRQIDAEGIVAR